MTHPLPCNGADLTPCCGPVALEMDVELECNGADLTPPLRAVMRPRPGRAVARRSYMRSITARPNPEQETSVAPSMRRAKS
jgi:hypothetical protein